MEFWSGWNSVMVGLWVLGQQSQACPLECKGWLQEENYTSKPPFRKKPALQMEEQPTALQMEEQHDNVLK
jgi:hypothetical protein